MAGCLLIVGASARACAESAVRAGYEPVSFDLFCDQDLLALGPATRLEAGYRDLDRMFPAGGEPWMYTGGLENQPRLVDRLAARRPLWGISGRALRCLRRPWRWCESLQAEGLPVPAWANAAGEPSLLKPLSGAGGKGIIPWAGGRLPPPWRAFRQRRIVGEPVASLFCAFANRVELLGTTRQIIGGPAGPFSYRGSVGPIDFGTAADGLRRLGAVLAAQSGALGLFGIDGILAEGRFVPVEVNPRYTASAEVIEMATGIPTVAWQAAAFGASPAPLPRPPARVVAKEIVYARQDTTVPDGLAGLPGLADIPVPGEIVPAGWPILTMRAAGATEDEAEEGLRSCREALAAKL
ncbi:MAG: ATP-grasp domain-containing protein [Planctomycetes bacterium]|nr:ATP-grasp domain-containing protein [Planctomycetota bacterium]